MAIEQLTNFNQLSPYEQVRLVDIESPKSRAEQAYCERLAALGVIPGMILTFIRSAPLGDPVEICVRGASLLLRKQEAAILKLKRLTL